ncbi:MAG: threonine/serine dehydratase [Firmicutes bacterium]|nr:threonine/serine dehydratase [Bacillota bacterium]
MSDVPTLQTIYAAQERLDGLIHRTPLVANRSLSSWAGRELRFKAENWQITGSFKVRGALNKIAELSRDGVPGVVTASSGNHGQAVAWAARHFALPARVVVPVTAPSVKVEAARHYGATIEPCGERSRERLERAQVIAQETGYAFVPPYDDPLVIAGQGTIGLEILSDWPRVDTVLVPVGGGGLISGIATAIKNCRPGVRVIGVEPEGAAKAQQSRRLGHRVELESTASIADGLITLALGHLTYPLIERYVDDLVTVSDAAIQQALWLIMTRMKMVVEPSGAAAAAYALSARPNLALGTSVAIVLSGGNLDPMHVNLLAKPPSATPEAR